LFLGHLHVDKAQSFIFERDSLFFVFYSNSFEHCELKMKRLSLEPAFLIKRKNIEDRGSNSHSSGLESDALPFAPCPRLNLAVIAL
jgi:hypothetical protein